jgi:DedD protein
MDQTLQARLIGATVLVALAVLLIPELLSGRRNVEPVVNDGAADRGTRTFTIELGAPGGQGAVLPSASSPSAPAKRDLTSPAARPPTSQATSSSSEGESGPPLPAPRRQSTDTAPAVAAVTPPTVTSPQPAPQPASQAASPAPGSTGEWVVQVGAFGSADTARRLVDELSAAGYAAQVAPVTRAGRTLHRVRVGPASGRAEAEDLAVRLKARRLPAAVVAID